MDGIIDKIAYWDGKIEWDRILGYECLIVPSFLFFFLFFGAEFRLVVLAWPISVCTILGQ